MACRCFIICLALSLCTTLSTSADEFLSIDCGSSLPYKDGNGITWVGDDKYVLSGESRSVKPENSTSYRVADTLRVFTTQNKNCYHIDSVKRGRVLVRAGFNYGNYDGKNSPPTFALHFDGNKWTDVDTSDYYFHEVTYVMKRDTTSICLTRTEPDQFPFITYLQIRSLEMPMYSNAANIYPLFLWKRVVFGTNTTIRDLSNNHFSGALPDSLANNKKIKLKLAGNSLQLPPPATTAIQLPPPIKTAKVIFPRRLLFPLAPNPPFGSGSFNQMPRAAGRIKTTKFPKILKFTLPPGAVATVLGTVYGICRCRRRRQ